MNEKSSSSLHYEFFTSFYLNIDALSRCVNKEGNINEREREHHKITAEMKMLIDV